MNRIEVMTALAACRALEAVLVEALANEGRYELETNGTAMTARRGGLALSAKTHQPWVSVHDEEQWRNWVALRYPEEVETLVRVRQSFQTAYLAATAKRGSPPQAKDGEIIPGLSWHPGGGFSHVQLRVAPEVKQQLESKAQAMVAGSVPLALPAVSDE